VKRLLVLVALVLAAGCSPSARQRVLNANATTVVQTQDAREAFYEEEHALCLEGPDIESYRQCMLPSTVMARAVDTFDRTLRAAQAALSASNQDAFEAMIPDLIRVASEVVRALRAAGVPVPDAVLSIASLAGGS
jgi:hypothetical protein